MNDAPRAPINYIFFGAYFAFVAFVHVFHVLLIEPTLSLSTFFFILCAIVQCAVETLLLIFLGCLIFSYLPRLMPVFVLSVFFLFLSHLIDFPLVRLMDMTFWYALHFITQESYENFIELLLASNVSLIVWILAGIGGVGLLMSGLFLYRLSEKWIRGRYLFVSLPMLGAAVGTTTLFLISWDFGLNSHLSRAFSDRYQKTLPWKTTFFPHQRDYVTLTAALSEPQSEEELMKKLDSRVFALAHKPDIYLFVVESLREDFITEENTPHLSRFKKDNLSFDMAFSNANATHISWFSLFHSQFPFYWGKVIPDEWKGGSLPLRLLKKMGYKIFVSSSARLTYYQMNRLIFGEGEYLADALFIPDDDESIEAYIRDQKAMDQVATEMAKGASGRVFIVFLDATHLDYSWPKEMTQFYPVIDKINYFTAGFSKQGLIRIKNRYRNALFFVDSLFGNFFKTLEESPGGQDAVVIVTGDHGEEFYEHGNLFHASSLSHPQMHIPLYYRFGKNTEIKEKAARKMTCHMDIFPSVFHYLIGEDLMGDVMQGESVFKSNRWPYTIIARFNASRSPYEFCIHNSVSKLLAHFSDAKDIFHSKGLKILSIKNCQDENIDQEIDTIHAEFDSAFERLFPTPSL